MLLLLIFLNFWTRFLVPEWFDPKIDKTRVNKAEYNGITINVENLLVNNQHMIFDIEILNESSRPVMFDNSVMYFLSSSATFPAQSDETMMKQFENNLTRNFAFSESQVREQYRHKIGEQRDKAFLIGLLAAGLIVFDVAMDVKDMNSKEWTPKMANATSARKALTMAGLATTDILQDNTERKAWQKGEDLYYLDQEILKNENLLPGQSIRGKVFFPTSTDKHFRLIIPIGDTDFSFDFREAVAADYQKPDK